MVRFLAGFLMAAGRFALPAAPFGVAMVAASGTGLAAGGRAGGGEPRLPRDQARWSEGIRYAAACVAAFTLLFILQDTRAARSRWRRLR